MADLGRPAEFLLEAAKVIGVDVRQDLQRHPVVARSIEGLVYPAEAARAQRRQPLEPGANPADIDVDLGTTRPARTQHLLFLMTGKEFGDLAKERGVRATHPAHVHEAIGRRHGQRLFEHARHFNPPIGGGETIAHSASSDAADPARAFRNQARARLRPYLTRCSSSLSACAISWFVRPAKKSSSNIFARKGSCSRRRPRASSTSRNVALSRSASMQAFSRGTRAIPPPRFPVRLARAWS